MKNKNRAFWAGVMTTALVGFTQSVSAQDDSVRIEEITVTAAKREQSI